MRLGIARFVQHLPERQFLIRKTVETAIRIVVGERGE